MFWTLPALILIMKKGTTQGASDNVKGTHPNHPADMFLGFLRNLERSVATDDQDGSIRAYQNCK